MSLNSAVFFTMTQGPEAREGTGTAGHPLQQDDL